MASNTKLGFALILLILTAFGFVVYKKAEQQKLEQAKIDKNCLPGEGDQNTFGDGGVPFGTGSDLADSSHDHKPFAHSDGASHNKESHHGHEEPRHDRQLVQADPGKPNLLESKEDPAFDKEPARHLTRTDLRRTVTESPAFGAELVAENDPVPFDSDEPHGNKQRGHADELPGDPQQQPPRPAAKKPATLAIDAKKRSESKDAFGGDVEPFDVEPAAKKSKSKTASNDEFGDPFGGEKDVPGDAEPFSADAEDAHHQPAKKVEKPIPLPKPQTDGEDAFGADKDHFADDSAQPQRRRAPIEPREVVPQIKQEDAHVHRPSPPGEEGFDRDEHHAGRADRGDESFGDNASSTFDGNSHHRHDVADGKGRGGHSDAGIRPDLAGQETYIVEAKDNFWSISRKKYGTARYFRLLAQLNQDAVPDPQQLQPGTAIVAPSKEFLETHYAEILAGGTTTQQVSAENIDGHSGESDQVGIFIEDEEGPRYRVGREDTLGEIAQRHLGRAARWIQIFELNRDRLSSPNDLRAGMELMLPADARQCGLVRAVHESR